jgi:hypothetical protein
VRELPTPNAASPDSVRAMSTALFFDNLGVRLNGSKPGDRAMTLGLTLSDIGESWTLMVRNGALSHRAGDADDTDVSVTIARTDLDEVILGTTPLATMPPRLLAVQRRRTAPARCCVGRTAGVSRVRDPVSRRAPPVEEQRRCRRRSFRRLCRPLGSVSATSNSALERLVADTTPQACHRRRRPRGPRGNGRFCISRVTSLTCPPRGSPSLNRHSRGRST